MTVQFIIKFILLSIIAYGIIKLSLSKHRIFKFKRAFLLLVPLLLFIASYFNFSIEKPIELTNIWLLDDIVAMSQENQNDKSPLFTLINFYLFGVIVFLLSRLIGLFRLQSLFRNAIRDDNYANLQVYKSSKAINLSFVNNILINKNLTREEESRIIHHEHIHITKKHSIDILFFNIYCILFWFNPIIHLLFKELKLTHEFEVDSESEFQVADTNPLLKYNIVFDTIASNYNFNNIKRRLEMKNNSNNKKTTLVFSSIAILFISLSFASATPEIAISSEKKQKATTPPTYDGDLIKELSQELKYPKELAEKGIEGRTIVNLTIGKEGEVKAHGITNSSGNIELDKEALRAALTLEKWLPAVKDGKKVTAITQIPIKFKLDKKKEK